MFYFPFSLIRTMDQNEPTREVTNTMDTDYGLVSTADRLWWAGAVTSRFGLRGVLKRYREET